MEIINWRSFGFGALSSAAICGNAGSIASMDNAVYDITTEQDQELATTKLETLGFSIDVLTDAQLAYLDDYTVGT